MGREGFAPFVLALGGGTARGTAHVGVLLELEALGLRPAGYAGTSFGAIVAALAALGVPPLELERMARQQNVAEVWSQAIDFGLHRAALVHGERWASWLDRKVFYGATFDDVEAPLAIAATDLETGEPVVVRQGSLVDAIRASCALPGMFAVPNLGGRWLLDGGFVEPVPYRAAADVGAGRVLGVHAGLRLQGSKTLERLRRLDAHAFGRWLQAAAARRSGRHPYSRLIKGLALSLRSYRSDPVVPPGADLLAVDPPIAWWDFHRSPAAIQAGREATRAWWRRRMEGAMLQAPLPYPSVARGGGGSAA